MSSVWASDGSYVCDFTRMVDAAKEKQAANIRLIAAATEMHGILTRMTILADAFKREHGLTSEAAAITDARALLASINGDA